jgi:hypothetical protein
LKAHSAETNLQVKPFPQSTSSGPGVEGIGGMLGRLPLPILPAGLNIVRSWRNGRLYRLPYWPIADRVDRIC